MKTNEEFERCAARLKALAEPERLRIVLCLLDGETRNVGQIAEHLGEDLAKVSHHLGVLRHAGIVTTQRQGRFINYRIAPNVSVSPPGEGASRTIEFGCCRIDLSTTKN